MATASIIRQLEYDLCQVLRGLGVIGEIQAYDDPRSLCTYVHLQTNHYGEHRVQVENEYLECPAYKDVVINLADALVEDLRKDDGRLNFASRTYRFRFQPPTRKTPPDEHGICYYI